MAYFVVGIGRVNNVSKTEHDVIGIEGTCRAKPGSGLKRDIGTQLKHILKSGAIDGPATG
ncbi:Uncharacterised protein [Vibrio cholerae]|nr:Uncharacterised protein [Vibrio cholerae]